MPEATDIHVGKAIRRIRHMRDLTQQELADKIGVKFQQLQKYETAMNRVSASRLMMIATALEVPVHEFFPQVETARDDYCAQNSAENTLLKSYRMSRSNIRAAVLHLLAPLEELPD